MDGKGKVFYYFLYYGKEKKLGISGLKPIFMGIRITYNPIQGKRHP
jgi:hypothetical protein